jgi:hypothetical protein
MEMASDRQASDIASTSVTQGESGALHRTPGCPCVVNQQHSLSGHLTIRHVSSLGVCPLKHRRICGPYDSFPAVRYRGAPLAHDRSEATTLLVALGRLAWHDRNEIEVIHAGCSR